ncbi:MAG: sugar phosphate isomerase/epimerase [Planctomycetales bacterium]|nr:sugar phosphate isomerase/epimerase [Planctomycetales bacterium]
MTTVDRRTFLSQSAATVATATAAAAGMTASLPRCGLAASPPARNGKPHFKLSLAAYSFNKYFARRGTPEQIAGAKMNLKQFIDFCAEWNLDGTELTSYYFPQVVTDEYLLTLKEQTFRLGLDISGTAIGNDFCLPGGDARRQQLQMCRQWIDYAAFLGAPVIRIFAGQVPRGDRDDDAVARCIDGINQSLEYAATKGVSLALENHGGITSTVDQMLKIVKGVEASPWFGVNFDSGNFRTADPYGDLERIAPYAINAQIKASIAPDGKSQPADYARILDILRRANYRGYVVLEYEEADDPWTSQPQHLDRLRELV